MKRLVAVVLLCSVAFSAEWSQALNADNRFYRYDEMKWVQIF